LYKAARLAGEPTPNWHHLQRIGIFLALCPRFQNAARPRWQESFDSHKRFGYSALTISANLVILNGGNQQECPSTLPFPRMCVVGCAFPHFHESGFRAERWHPHRRFWRFLGIFLVVGLICYIYFALALQTIAQKTNTPNAWFAWIPIAIAKKPLWRFLLFLLPIVNLVVTVLVLMAVAEARNKPNWRGILTLVPVANLIVPAELAWSD
jgi:hypothetical protein